MFREGKTIIPAGLIPEAKFEIYQLDNSPVADIMRFRCLDSVNKAGGVQRKHYEKVYEGRKGNTHSVPGELLEDLYNTFNIERPKDFTGHSMSVGDVVVLGEGENSSAHFCDSIGWVDITEQWFTAEKDANADVVIEQRVKVETIATLLDEATACVRRATRRLQTLVESAPLVVDIDAIVLARDELNTAINQMCWSLPCTTHKNASDANEEAMLRITEIDAIPENNFNEKNKKE